MEILNEKNRNGEKFGRCGIRRPHIWLIVCLAAILHVCAMAAMSRILLAPVDTYNPPVAKMRKGDSAEMAVSVRLISSEQAAERMPDDPPKLKMRNQQLPQPDVSTSLAKAPPVKKHKPNASQRSKAVGKIQPDRRDEYVSVHHRPIPPSPAVKEASRAKRNIKVPAVRVRMSSVASVSIQSMSTGVPDGAAEVVHMPSPEYPAASVRRNEQGLVVLMVRVLASGEVGQVSVRRSSGYDRLDNAAASAVKKAKFKPASKNGRNITDLINVPVRFVLN